MDEFYSAEDPYTYPGSPVLRNKLGLRDQDVLDGHERLYVTARLLQSTKPPPTFDYTHFRALHFHMFQDIYGWAGLERNVSIRKGVSEFAAPGFIRPNGLRILGNLRIELRDKRHAFAELPRVLGHFINEMNVLHPFREGNGRVLREFVLQVANALGCGIDASALGKERWLAACIAGFHQDDASMTELMGDLLITPPTRRGSLGALPQHTSEQRARFCALVRKSKYPDEIKQEYRATFGC